MHKSKHKEERVYDCVVIGAGLAGLVAAQDMIKAGLNVLVLEAQDTPGGRVQTDKITGVDLGPSWIHGTTTSGKDISNGVTEEEPVTNATLDLFLECGGDLSQLVPSSHGNWWLLQEKLADECALYLDTGQNNAIDSHRSGSSNQVTRVSDNELLFVVREAEQLFQLMMQEVQTRARWEEKRLQEEDTQTTPISLRTVVDELLPVLIEQHVDRCWRNGNDDTNAGNVNGDDEEQQAREQAALLLEQQQYQSLATKRLLLTRVLQFLLAKIQLWMAADLADLNLTEWAEDADWGDTPGTSRY